MSFNIFQLRANDTLIVRNDQKYHLREYISVYTDKTKSKSFDEIKNLFENGEFVKFNESEIFKPLTTYWIEFDVKNQTLDQGFFVFSTRAPISHLEVYAIINGEISVQKNESVNNYHKIKIICPSIPGYSTRYFIKIYQESALEFSLKDCYLSARGRFVKELISQSALTGWIIGILVLMFVYNLFRFIFRKKRVYIYYVLYVLFSIVFILHGSYLQEYVFSPVDNFKLIWIYMALPVSDFFYIIFIRRFIEPQNIPFKIDNYFYKPFIGFVVISTIFLGYLAITDSYLFMKFYYMVPPIYALIGLALAIVLIIYVKKPESTYALIGNSIAITSGIVSLWLDNEPFLENNHIFNFGLVIDIFFFTYALSLKEKREDDIMQKSELDLALMKMEMEGKQRELTTKAFHVARQGEMILKVKNDILDIKGERGHISNALLNVLTEVDLYHKQNDWDDFEIYFKEVHPAFYEDLLKKYPLLSQYDLRICALIRLNMSTKQIASVFRKTPKSIEVARTRIRHKMQLSSEESLFGTLSTI